MESTDWIALSVIVYLCMAFTMCLYIFIAKKGSVFEPISQYIFFLSLFVLPLPIRTYFTLAIEGNVSPNLLNFLSSIPFAVLLSALSMPLFAFSYYSNFSKQLAKKIPFPISPRKGRSGLAFIFLAILSVSLLAVLAESSGGLLNFLLLGYGSTEKMHGFGFLAVGFPWLFVAIMFLFYRYAVYRRKRDAFLCYLGLIVIICINVLLGNRSMILYIALVVFIFVHYAIKPLSIKLLLPVGLAGFLALNVLGLVRTSNYKDFDDFIGKSITSAQASTTEEVGILYTLTIGEFVVPFETLPQMIESIGSAKNPWFGLSYLYSPVYIVPSVIFPFRPLPLANWYMVEYYSGDSSKLNEGRQFFFLAEAYLNFGALGIALLSFAWGWLWGAVNQWRAKNNNPAVVLVYALFVGFMFRCIAGDAASLIAGFTQQSLAAALVGLAITGVAWRKQLREAT